MTPPAPPPDRREIARAALLFAAACAIPAVLLLAQLGARGNWDWDKDFTMADVQRAALLHYGELPWWNPWSYGGMPMLAHPESTFLSPSFWLLVLPLGAIAGHQVRLVVALWAGALGAWRLARSHGAEGPGAALAGAAYMLSGYAALHFWMGHSMWATVAIVPWLLQQAGDARRSRRSLACAALLLGWIVLEGALYVVLFTAAFLGLHGLLESIRERSRRPLQDAVLVTLLGLGASGVKLVPMLDFLSRHPRLHVADRAFGANDLATDGLPGLAVLLARGDYARHLPFEDGAYVGWGVLALAALGAVVSFRRTWPLQATGAAFAVIAMGDGGVPGLWSALHELPVLRQTLLPARWLFGALIPLAVLSGLGLGWIARRTRPSVAWIAFVVLLADFHARNWDVHATMFPGRRVPPPFQGGPIRGHARAEGEWTMFMLPWFRDGLGLLNGQPDVPRPVPRALGLNDPGHRGEWHADGAEVTLVEWSPSEVTLAVGPSAGPVRVVLNQNWDPGWSAAPARAEESPEGLLSAIVEGGTTLRFRHRPRFGLAGALLSAASLATLAGLAFSRGRPAPG